MPGDSSTPIGKKYKGDSSPTFQTPEDVQAMMDAQKPYNKEGAVEVMTYFSMRGIKNPVMQASMLAYTKVRKATPEDFDTIFKDH